MAQPAPTPESPPENLTSPSSPLATSLASRLFNVFAAPREVFEEVEARPEAGANWLVPALMLMAVSWLGVWLVFSQESIRHQLSDITDQAIQKQIASHRLSEQQGD